MATSCARPSLRPLGRTRIAADFLDRLIWRTSPSRWPVSSRILAKRPPWEALGPGPRHEPTDLSSMRTEPGRGCLTSHRLDAQLPGQ